MTCVALVTARGESKGLPDKNLAEVGGRPLVARAVEVARASRLIDRCLVTTDSERIRDVAVAAGADAPFLRPAALATDDARQEEAVAHAMDWLAGHGERAELICLLEPTSPLRTPATVDAAIALLRSRPDAEAVISVVDAGLVPYRAKALDDDGFMRAWANDPNRWANRQELPVLHRPVGVVAVSRWDAFERERTFVHSRTLGLVVDPVEAIDVDGPLDLALAHCVLTTRLR